MFGTKKSHIVFGTVAFVILKQQKGVVELTTGTKIINFR